MPTFQPIDAQIEELNGLDGITLPINGKHYTIPAPDAATGLEVTRLMEVVTRVANDQGAPTEAEVENILTLDRKAGGDLISRIMGPALDEMVADGVKWPVVKLAFTTALFWISQSAEEAAIYWASGGGDLGKAPNRQTRRATRKAPPASAASRRRKPTATTLGA